MVLQTAGAMDANTWAGASFVRINCNNKLSAEEGKTRLTLVINKMDQAYGSFDGAKKTEGTGS